MHKSTLFLLSYPEEPWPLSWQRSYNPGLPSNTVPVHPDNGLWQIQKFPSSSKKDGNSTESDQMEIILSPLDLV